MTIHLKITMNFKGSSPAESNVMKNALKKWRDLFFFFHKMSYNIFTGYLSIGKWYSIDAELSEPSISVFKVKICLEFGEILRPKDHRLVLPLAKAKISSVT